MWEQRGIVGERHESWKFFLMGGDVLAKIWLMHQFVDLLSVIKKSHDSWCHQPPICSFWLFLFFDKRKHSAFATAFVPLLQLVLSYSGSFGHHFYPLWQVNCWDLGPKRRYRRVQQVKEHKQIDDQTGCKQTNSLAKWSKPQYSGQVRLHLLPRM